MTPLQIVLSALAGLLLLLLSLLFFGRARLSISYLDDLRVTLSILGVKNVLLAPKEETPKALKDLTDCKNLEKKILRALKREQRRAKKTKKKQAKIDAKRAKRKEKREAKKQNAPRLSIGETLSLVSHLTKKAYEITKGKLRLRIKHLSIKVGSGDAATTAILYGSLSALLSGLFDFLDTNYIPTKIDKGAVSITPDFTSESCSGKISLALSTSIFRMLLILAKGGASYVRERAFAEAHAEKRLQNKSFEDSSAPAE